MIAKLPAKLERKEDLYCWLASTLEIKASEPVKKTRDGIGDRIPNDVEDVGSGFTIRINTRTPTR